MTGTVKKILPDKGYGFVRGHDGKEFFFHSTAVRGCVFEELQEGTRVEFDEEAARKQNKGPRACNVRVADDEHNRLED